ncbi:HNH endonuclease signature motif containing protein [Streptomyces sp. NPDC056632]|uniref:HNH endonuclease signature motif containing protein n=1 Tax=Streptomyces sp. NPDC056632 TaxID=3345884 RepID=UPI0036A42392
MSNRNPVPPPGAKDRCLSRVTKTDTCWLWSGTLTKDGCGSFRFGLTNAAHRASYLLFVGPIPEGLQVDHVCHNWDETCAGGDTCRHRRCVNPAHLEAVTKRDNVLRGKTIAAIAAAKTHCPEGHPYDEANTIFRNSDGARVCRACRRALEAKRKKGKPRLHGPNPVLRMLTEHFPDEAPSAVLDRAVRAYIAQQSA